MCGLYGFSGAGKADLNKIKVLALYNLERGPDSAGIYINGDTQKTIKTIHELLADEIIEYDQENETVIIGHTRKTSSGAISLANAHPFMNYDANGNMLSAFAHNGTLHFWKDDLKKYIGDTKDYDVDSKALGKAMTDEHYKYLEEFEGAVTYVMVRPDNVLEVFKGASIEYKDRKYSEDRPMYYLTAEEGIYFSSMYNSLCAIQQEDEKIFSLSHNEVFRFKDGECIFSEKVNRQKEEWLGYSYGYGSMGFTTGGGSKSTSKSSVNTSTQSSKKENAPSTKKAKRGYKLWSNSIDYDINVFRSAVYFNRGRYYRNGHLLDSFNKVLETGELQPYYIDKDSFKVVRPGYDSIENAVLYYFYKGMMLKAIKEDDVWSSFGLLYDIFEVVKDNKWANVDKNSRTISTLVEGVFAFLPCEVNNPHIVRNGVYHNGENVYDYEKSYKFNPYFVRPTSYFFGNVQKRLTIYDTNHYEQDFKELSTIASESVESQGDFLEMTRTEVEDYFKDIVNTSLIHEYFELFQSRHLFDNERYDFIYNRDGTGDIYEDSSDVVHLSAAFKMDLANCVSVDELTNIKARLDVGLYSIIPEEIALMNTYLSAAFEHFGDEQIIDKGL